MDYVVPIVKQSLNKTQNIKEVFIAFPIYVYDFYICHQGWYSENDVIFYVSKTVLIVIIDIN